MKLFFAAALLLTGACPASAQVREYLKKKKQVEDPAPLALALNLTFSTTFWQEVSISTNGPVADLTVLVRAGCYKLELIELVLMSHDGLKALSKTYEKRKKGESLSDIAADYHLSYEKLYESSLAVQEIVDKQYLPLFPEKRPRRERNDD